MIVAAGLTPAWQQMLVFDSLEIGAVNRAQEVYKCASGKVTNVGLALHFLGGPNHTLSVAGGVAGTSIRHEFEQLGVSCQWLTTRSSTRVAITVMDRGSGATTELVENASGLESSEVEAYVSAYAAAIEKAEMVILSGSLPPGAGEGFYRSLLEKTPPGCRAIVDARGPELQAALKQKPFLVKPNREELGMTVGGPLESDEDLRDGIAKIQALGAENVLVSDGPGPLWLGQGDALYRLQPLSVETVNPIACGDCLAAGVAWALARHRLDLVEAVRVGIAAAAANAAAMLPSRLDPQRVLAAKEDVEVDRVA